MDSKCFCPVTEFDGVPSGTDEGSQGDVGQEEMWKILLAFPIRAGSMQGHRELSSGLCQWDTTRSASDIFLCDLQWNVSGISIETDGECVTAALV